MTSLDLKCSELLLLLVCHIPLEVALQRVKVKIMLAVNHCFRFTEQRLASKNIEDRIATVALNCMSVLWMVHTEYFGLLETQSGLEPLVTLRIHFQLPEYFIMSRVASLTLQLDPPLNHLQGGGTLNCLG